MSKLFKLDNFYLKLIAIITMTLDHIGRFMLVYCNSSLETTANIFMYIGRLSFPLFAFLVVEGAIHTKNLVKYSIRMGIMAIVVAIFLLVFQYSGYAFASNIDISNIFLLFFISLLTIIFLNKKGYKKLLAIIPFSYIIFSYVMQIMIINVDFSFNAYFPMAFRAEYGIYGYIMIVGGYLLIKYYNNKIHNICETSSINEDDYKSSSEYRRNYNFLSIVPLLVLTALITIIKYIPSISILDTLNSSIQSYAAISAIFIFLYSGKLGYYNKYVKYGFYIYYPLHIALIFLIFVLIF